MTNGEGDGGGKSLSTDDGSTAELAAVETSNLTGETAVELDVASESESVAGEIEQEEDPENSALSAIFDELRKRASACGLEAKYDPDIPSWLRIDFKNGKKKRSVWVSSKDQAEGFLRIEDLGNITFLGDYNAACCYQEKWIEAAVRPLGGVSGRVTMQRRLFGTMKPEEGQELLTRSADGICLRLSPFGTFFSHFSRAPLYLRIEGASISQHDEALDLLEEIADALFIQIDLRFESALGLDKDRSSIRRLSARPRRLDEDNQLSYPRYAYDKKATKLYWYGRSAFAMPLLQFLAFYQCIEFFFPLYSRRGTIEKVRNLLKAPTFDGTRDSDLSNLVDIAGDAQRASDERTQLRATITACIEEQSLRDFFSQDEERQKFFKSGYKATSKVQIQPNGDLVNSTAERIYDLRCRIVHTKSSDRGSIAEMILPLSDQADAMIDDIALVQFIARKVLVASSTPMR